MLQYEDISNLYEAGKITMDEAVKLRIAYWNGMLNAVGNIERLQRKKELINGAENTCN